MYKRVIVVPYKGYSGSAKLLKQALQQHLNIPVLTVLKTSKTYQPRWTDYVINWGCSAEWDWINLTEKKPNQDVVNKLTFFKVISAYNSLTNDLQVNIPEWTDSLGVAAQWVMEGVTVVGRKKLNGHSGDGIVIYEQHDMVQHCPLYVKYKKKRHEYRVHFFNNQIIDITQKKKRKGAEFLDTKIRNHKNGWVYCRDDIMEPTDLREQALRTAKAVGLKFGAVDLIWNEKENKSYVLEVNTAPGLVGTTLDKYTEAFLLDIQK